MRCHPDLEHQKKDWWHPEQNSIQGIEALVDPPSSAQHVVDSHTREGSAPMTTSAPHVTIMTMQHTCAGHPSRHLNRVL